MNKTTRKNNLILPNGEPKYVRIYDNGGKTADRYCAVYTGNYRGRIGSEFEKGRFQYRGMSEFPFHPQGFGQGGESETQVDVNRWGFAPMIGRSNHLGKRIHFKDLPADCQKLVLRDYKEIWGLINS